MLSILQARLSFLLPTMLPTKPKQLNKVLTPSQVYFEFHFSHSSSVFEYVETLKDKYPELQDIVSHPQEDDQDHKYQFTEVCVLHQTF